MGPRDARPLPEWIGRAVHPAWQHLRRGPYGRCERRAHPLRSVLSRFGDVRQLRRDPALRSRPGHPRYARRRGLGAVAGRDLRRGSEEDGPDPRAGPRAGADRPLSAAHAQPAGAQRFLRPRSPAHRGGDRLRRVRRAARRRAEPGQPLQRQRRQGAGLGQRSGHPAVEHRHRAADRRPARSQRAGRRKPPRRQAADSAAGRGVDARVRAAARRDAVPRAPAALRSLGRGAGAHASPASAALPPAPRSRWR